MTRFHACLRDDDPCRLLPVPEAGDAMEAALLYLERRAPDDDAEDAAVIVEDRETGARQCFRIDLQQGGARPC